MFAVQKAQYFDTPDTCSFISSSVSVNYFSFGANVFLLDSVLILKMKILHTPDICALLHCQVLRLIIVAWSQYFSDTCRSLFVIHAFL